MSTFKIVLLVIFLLCPLANASQHAEENIDLLVFKTTGRPIKEAQHAEENIDLLVLIEGVKNEFTVIPSWALAPAKAGIIQPQAKRVAKDECQYFLKTGIENDLYGDDYGYTHGHLTSLIQECPNGKNLILSFNSRFFTGFHDFLVNIKDNTYANLIEFQEENELKIEHTNWRQFGWIYQTLGLRVGLISDNNRYVSGNVHEIVHDLEGKQGNIILEKTERAVGRDRYIQYYDEIFRSANIRKYIYKNGQGGEQFFMATKVAVGKSFHLYEKSHLEEPDYLRLEVGAEVHSMAHSSNLFVEGEISLSLFPKYLSESVYLHLQVKGEKVEGSKNNSSQSALGLNIKILPGLKAYYSVKKRNLPTSPNPALHLDSDEDIIHGIGIQIRL